MHSIDKLIRITLYKAHILDLISKHTFCND